MRFTIFVCIIIFSSCGLMQPSPTPHHIDWQGHRGCRGIMPENTLPAFIKALDIGVNTLELDLAVSQDSQLVVSHEPWMSHLICTKPDGSPVTEAEEDGLRIFDMSYATIRQYDCGSRPHPRFPEQTQMKVEKPLLLDVFQHCEQYRKTHNLPLFSYNIEIKSRPDWDSIYTPHPTVFADLLIATLQHTDIDMNRFCIQSFDVRPLQYLHQHHPDITLAYLVEEAPKTTDSLTTFLGFTPDIYSPYYPILDKNNIQQAHKQGMKVIPWTVNDKETAQQLIRMGVDGIITDYPDRVRE